MAIGRGVFMLGCLLAVAAPARGDVCVDCHRKVTPGVVTDWELSKHSKSGTGCGTCHGSAHQSASDAAKAQSPTPDTCAGCHDARVRQFKQGKHAAAWIAMRAMPTIHAQPMALIDGQKGCGGCHKIGTKTVDEIEDLSKPDRDPGARGGHEGHQAVQGGQGHGDPEGGAAAEEVACPRT